MLLALEGSSLRCPSLTLLNYQYIKEGHLSPYHKIYLSPTLFDSIHIRWDKNLRYLMTEPPIAPYPTSVSQKNNCNRFSSGVLSSDRLLIHEREDDDV